MSAEAAAGEPAERARESVSPKAVRPRLWWVPKTLLFGPLCLFLRESGPLIGV